MNETQRFVTNAKCCALTVEDFAEVIYMIPQIDLGKVGGCEWYVQLLPLCEIPSKHDENLRVVIFGKYSEDGVDYLSIDAEANGHDVLQYLARNCGAFSVELAICVKNKKLERWEKRHARFEMKKFDRIGFYKFMRMDTILGPKSGFLSDDGSLMAQVEIRIDSMTCSDGRKRLKTVNIFDPIEGSVQVQFKLINFHVSKQMLILHSSVIAKQLAGGCEKVVISGDVLDTSVFIFFQLMHEVNYDLSAFRILDVLYLAHKYQVLTVLRQVEIQIKSLPETTIFYIQIPFRCGWIKTWLGEHHHKDLRRMARTGKQLYCEEYKELNIRKRKMLLAITRAPFSPDLDSRPSVDNADNVDDISETKSHRNDNNLATHTPPSSSFSIVRFFSRTVKRITCC